MAPNRDENKKNITNAVELRPFLVNDKSKAWCVYEGDTNTLTSSKVSNSYKIDFRQRIGNIEVVFVEG